MTLPMLLQNMRQDHDINSRTHSFIHVWSAYLSFRGGEQEPLSNEYCHCHWRGDLHSPAAFPRTGRRESSVMGGSLWDDNGDGTFTPSASWSGLSWLDLYAMGLADASEVPDTFVLRNLEAVVEGSHNPRGETYRGGVYTGDREIVSIEQVVAAEGLRRPSAIRSQKNFNFGFVYLLAPGQAPSSPLLKAHAQFAQSFVENWFQITGGRSRMTTTVPGVANRSPVAVGTLADQTVLVDDVAVVDVGGAFRDPDGDPLNYEATSSAPSVASVAVSGSTLTVRAVEAGTARVIVTATDTSGSNTTATLAFRVTVGVPVTFTDDPIVPGETPIKAVHFKELRERIDVLRTAGGLEPFSWTDPILTAGVTPVRLSHLLELRDALDAVYGVAGLVAPVFTDAAPMSGTTPIRAAHLMELRAAVVALQ